MANELFGKTKYSIDEWRVQAKDSSFTPMLLEGLSFTINTKLIKEKRQTENVAAILEGNDAELKHSFIVYTAHYDHVGKHSNGEIYHGADDNASGTTGVLEIAEAFTANSIKPKQSILFIQVSGEEKGLLGSSYFVSQPSIPLDKISANINLDMIGRTDTKHNPTEHPKYIYVIGTDKNNSLDSIITVANIEIGDLELDRSHNKDSTNDPYYRGSDHSSFSKKGIPAVFFSTGIHSDYHKPTDTSEKIEFEKMEKVVRLAYYAGWKIANIPQLFRKIE